MLRFMIFGFLYLLVNADDYKCRVDNNSDDSVSISCYYLKLDDKDIPLDSNLPSSVTRIALNLIHCTGKINSASFPNLREMDTLNLIDMDLDEFPELPELPKLDYMRIKNTKISSINGVFKNTKSLNALTLEKNKKMVLDDESFKGLSLGALVITKQPVTLTKNLLKDLKSLKTLSISRGGVDKISAGVFDENIELEYLRLDKNPIKTIESEAFDKLEKLKSISLIPSDLETFNVDLVKKLSKLETLGIPARSVKNFDVKKFLEYCPHFSGFLFLPKDTECKEVQDLEDKLQKYQKYVVIFAGVNPFDKSC